jgi:hypothetical protein
MTHGLVQAHLNILLKLFVATRCIITLEEVCNGNFGAHFPASQPDKASFGRMVELAAEQWDQDWVVKDKPTDESTFGRGVWRAQQVSWVRHREWNRKFAKLGPAPAPFLHPLYK